MTIINKNLCHACIASAQAFRAGFHLEDYSMPDDVGVTGQGCAGRSNCGRSTGDAPTDKHEVDDGKSRATRLPLQRRKQLKAMWT